MKTIYQVIDCGVDGKASFVKGFFESKEDAEMVKNKETAYGQGSVREITVFGNLGSYEEFKKQRAVSNAKSKLTKEELKLLRIE